MIIDTDINDKTVDYILDNLSERNLEELEVSYGHDCLNLVRHEIMANINSYDSANFGRVKTNSMYIVKTDDNTPVIITGLLPLGGDTSALFFLHTEELATLPHIELLKKSIKYIKQWKKAYQQTIQSCIYKKNKDVMRWVRLLGMEKVDDFPDFVLYEG